MPKNLKRLVDDATESYGPGSGWEEEFGEIIVGARVELERYDKALSLLKQAKRSCGEVIFAKIEAFLAAEGRK